MELNEYKGFIFDLDGVVWHGKTPIPGVAEALSILRREGKRICFVTNNASLHRSGHLKKLLAMGVKAKLSQVITSGSTAANVIKNRFGVGKVFVMGTDELESEMTEVGHTLSREDAQHVVVGLDFEFNYNKLDTAFRNVHYNKATLIVCADTATFPKEDGLHPGTGSLAKALCCACGKESDIVTGKPSKEIMGIALDTLNLQASECVMIGDVLEDDILGGMNAGIDTLFVLSGKNSKEDIDRTGISPTYTLDSVADLANLF